LESEFNQYKVELPTILSLLKTPCYSHANINFCLLPRSYGKEPKRFGFYWKKLSKWKRNHFGEFGKKSKSLKLIELKEKPKDYISSIVCIEVLATCNLQLACVVFGPFSIPIQ
jgi:hypothetical protein